MIARNLSFKTVVLLVGIGPEYKKFGKNDWIPWLPSPQLADGKERLS